MQQYKEKLHPLGFGVMRLPMNPDGTFPREVHNLLISAYEQGINYFDTAYPYLGGHSEELIRDALVRSYPRESFYIADKMPVWECHSREDMERIFDIQLERLGTEYIDFYLLHGLNRFRWADMKERGALDFLSSKRREGRIRHAGFSIHDDKQTLESIIDAYGWEFALLQINYYDWVVQNAKGSYELLAARNIPCMVMEPVGGGRLAKLPKNAENLLKAARPEDSAASWAIRFAAGLPNVIVTLSGMSNAEQLSDNLKYFAPFKPLSEKELSLLDDVVNILSSQNTVPCSGCMYCVEQCPKGIDIPQIFNRFNDYRQFTGTVYFGLDYFGLIPAARRGDKCVKCGHCIGYCPQKIDIPEELAKIHDAAAGHLIGVDIERLKNRLENGEKLVCFGAGAMGRNALSPMRECGIEAAYFCDNGEELWGTRVEGVDVISPERLQEISREEDVCVLITSSYHSEIKEQLGKLGVNIFS